MKALLPLFRLLKNYKLKVVLHIVSNILMAFFTVISIPATIPLFRIFFGKVDEVVVKPQGPLGIGNFEEYSKWYVHDLVQSADSPSDALITICALLLSIFFFKNLFTYLASYFIIPVRTGIVADYRQMMYDKFMRLPLSYFSNEKKGDLISRTMSDVHEVEISILSMLEKAVREPLLIIGSLLIMLWLSPGLTGFVGILIILTAVVIGGISRRLRKQSEQAQSTLGLLMSRLDESLFGLKIIKGFSAEARMQQRFGEVNNRYKNILTKVLWRRDLASPMSEFLGIAVVCVLFWFGSRLVFAGDLDAEQFLAFILAFFYIINPAKSFSSAYYNIQKGLAAVDRIDHIMMADERIVSPQQPVHLDGFDHSIVYHNVTFNYDGVDTPALNGVDLAIEKGEIVALAGSSGAGKTTLADLLPRFYDVTGGKITIDGIDLRELKISELRSLVGLVTQEPVLFNDTIEANIAFGKPDATKEMIEEASQIANAHQFIIESPQGYQTLIGDRGTKLSGGQRQRISIARAILKNPPILILDEATSALDSESEKLVQEALQEVMKGRTSIVIAHRLSTIQNADKIVVMKDGQIVESGRHIDLLELDGEYRKFVRMQAF